MINEGALFFPLLIIFTAIEEGDGTSLTIRPLYSPR